MLQANAKRKVILQAALDAFSQQGFHNAPTSLIARIAGVGEGSIYRNFESKDQIITALHEDIFQRLAAAANNRIDTGRSVRANILGSLRNVLFYLLKHPQEFRFLEQFHFSPYGIKQRRSPDQQHDRPFLDLLKQGVEQKLIKALPLELLFGLCFGPLVFFIRDHLVTNSAVEDDVIDEMLNACWDAIKVE